jgi:hypothetical protein
MKRENKNLAEENTILQARLRQFVDHMASQVCSWSRDRARYRGYCKNDRFS